MDVCVCADAIYIVRGRGGVIDSSNGTNLFRDHRDLSSRLEVEGHYCGFFVDKTENVSSLNLTYERLEVSGFLLAYSLRR